MKSPDRDVKQSLVYVNQELREIQEAGIQSAMHPVNGIQGFPGISVLKNPLANQETWIRPLSWEDPLEKEMTTHSSILAWEIPWTEEWWATVDGVKKEPDKTQQLNKATVKWYLQALDYIRTQRVQVQKDRRRGERTEPNNTTNV